MAVDSRGKQLTVAATPQRVVTLDQNSTETLLALGLQDRMAGTANVKTKVAPRFAELARITASLTWITPFEQTMSVLTTFAPSIVTTPSPARTSTL